MNPFIFIRPNRASAGGGDYDPKGTAASLIASHVAAADPHTQYQRKSTNLTAWSSLAPAAYSNTAQTNALIAAAIAGLVDGAPEQLDTIKEIAAALGNDANLAATLTAQIAAKQSPATTLAGYGITNAYTKGEVDALIPIAESLEIDNTANDAFIAALGLEATTVEELAAALDASGPNKAAGAISSALWIAAEAYAAGAELTQVVKAKPTLHLSTTDPTADHDGVTVDEELEHPRVYRKGDWWLNTEDNTVFVCLSDTAGDALWVRVQTGDDDMSAYVSRTEGDGRYDAKGDALAAVVAHEAKADPHPQYLTLLEADLAFGLKGALALISQVTPAANTFVYFSDADTAATSTITNIGRQLVSQTSAAGMRTVMGMAIGSNIQAYDRVLDILSSLKPDADQVPYFTDSGHAAMTSLTEFGREIIGYEDEAEFKAGLHLTPGTHIQPFSGRLASITALEDQGLLVIRGGSTVTIQPMTDYMSDILNISSSELLVESLGLVIGQDILAYNPNLENLQQLAPAYGRLIVGQANGWGIMLPGSNGQLLIADNTTSNGVRWGVISTDDLNLGDMAAQNADDVDITGGKLAGLTSVATIKLEAGSGTLTGVALKGLPNPVADGDAASKKWVEDQIGIGTTDPQLLALAALEPPTSKTLPMFTSAATATLVGISDFGVSLLATSSSDALVTGLALKPGVNVQPHSDGLDAFLAMPPTKGHIFVGDGTGWSTLQPGIDGWVVQADSESPLGVRYVNPGTFALDDTLEAIGNTPTEADTLIYFTGVDQAAATSFTAYGRTLAGLASAAALRTNLGLEIGLTVQAYSSKLDELAAIGSDKGAVLVGQGAHWTVFGGGATGQHLVADEDSPTGLKWEYLPDGIELPTVLREIANLGATANKFLIFTGPDTVTAADVSSAAQGLLSKTTVPQMWDHLALRPGVNVLRQSERLDNIASTPFGSNPAPKAIMLTGPSTVDTFTVTEAGRTLVGQVSNADMLDLLGLVVGADIQAWDQGLQDIAELTPVKGSMLTWDGDNWVELKAGEDTQLLMADSLKPGGLAWKDLSGDDAILPDAVNALSPLIIGANKLAYYNSGASAALTNFTAYGRTLVGLADANALRTNIGLVIGTQVQAHSAVLDVIGDLTPAANKGLFFTSGTDVALYDLSAYGRTLVGLADANALKANIGLPDLLAAKAPLASPDFTGTPLAPTPAQGDESKKIATTEFAALLVRSATAAQAAFDPAGLLGILTNPFFEISQQNGQNLISNPAATPAYGADQWYSKENWTTLQISVQNVSRPFASDAGYGRLSNGIKVVVTTPQSTGFQATDAFEPFVQDIEGRVFAALGWGTADAIDAQIVGVVKASFTGKLPLSITNGANNRSYVTTIDVVADVPTPFSVIIPGDKTGTWATDNGVAATLRFGGVYGSPFITASKDVWQAGAFYASSDSLNWPSVANRSLTLGMMQVFLVGVLPFTASSAMNALTLPHVFNLRRPYTDELLRCERYFRVLGGAGLQCKALSQTQVFVTASFPQEMRGNPTMSVVTGAFFNIYSVGTTTSTTNAISYQFSSPKGTELRAENWDFRTGWATALITCGADKSFYASARFA
ncbi:hypothetical protein [Hyphomicrobium sp.]|uniref:hypothetical protein n=1 Tax=Hyphomicrobium sp. TaxID=82 RepID=UPI001E0CDA10|nr:hypothetical protein [Hyphomicrobium sp.]MBY0560140.1 hypothetical protein [Hyphomicrobium sp.]